MNQPRQHQAISISNATVVTPDAVLSPGFVRIEDGRFLEVQAKTGPHGGPDVCNARGALLLLGLLDIHAEALEAAIAPRPSAPFDPAFVLPSYDAHLVACGITTVFHFREKALAILVALHAFAPMPGSAASSIHAMK